MSLDKAALFSTHEFPIRHEGEVHNGKVRSVYWLNKSDSLRILDDLVDHERKIDTDKLPQLGVMVISDRLSAFDVIWQAEEGLQGVPGKGAALNTVSNYWFKKFNEAELAGNHILDTPHPLVWIVEKASPIMVEAVARQYITGSMWRDYGEGKREICGIALPEGLKQNQRLDSLLITPTTKGILKGIPGVPESDDVNISKEQIVANYRAFGFESPMGVALYETLLERGFRVISEELAKIGQLFVDTKFEFGHNSDGKMIYIDEIGTPDSSRIWDAGEYAKGKVVENSKEGFRQFLLTNQDRDILLNKKRMPERRELAKTYRVPVDVFMDVSRTYTGIAEKITGQPLPRVENPREEILSVLSDYQILT